jgi:hypothetical protein
MPATPPALCGTESQQQQQQQQQQRERCNVMLLTPWLAAAAMQGFLHNPKLPQSPPTDSYNQGGRGTATAAGEPAAAMAVGLAAQSRANTQPVPQTPPHSIISISIIINSSSVALHRAATSHRPARTPPRWACC